MPSSSLLSVCVFLFLVWQCLPVVYFQSLCLSISIATALEHLWSALATAASFARLMDGSLWTHCHPSALMTSSVSYFSVIASLRPSAPIPKNTEPLALRREAHWSATSGHPLGNLIPTFSARLPIGARVCAPVGLLSFYPVRAHLFTVG